MSNVEKILKQNWINYKKHIYLNKISHHFALEASKELWIWENRIFKTLIVEWDKEFYVWIISCEDELDLKKFAKIIGAKKVAMWNKDLIEKITWYQIWWISPIWQKKKLKIFIDIKANNSDTIFISWWNKWVEIEINPNDLSKMLNARFVKITK